MNMQGELCRIPVPTESQNPYSQLLDSAMANAGKLGALADSQSLEGNDAPLEGNDAPIVQGLKVCAAR